MVSGLVNRDGRGKEKVGESSFVFGRRCFILFYVRFDLFDKRLLSDRWCWRVCIRGYYSVLSVCKIIRLVFMDVDIRKFRV